MEEVRVENGYKIRDKELLLVFPIDYIHLLNVIPVGTWVEDEVQFSYDSYMYDETTKKLYLQNKSLKREYVISFENLIYGINGNVVQTLFDKYGELYIKVIKVFSDSKISYMIQQNYKRYLNV